MANESLRTRIARLVAGSDWPQPLTTGATTAAGLTDEYFDQWARPFIKASSSRMDVYKDVKEMDATVEEVATALDMLADNSVGVKANGQASFEVAYIKKVSPAVRDLIQDTLERTQWSRKAYRIARNTMMLGDDFEQYIFDKNMRIVRMMYMPPESMYRNEDQQGLLLQGKKQGEWAFEQYDNGKVRLIAGFYPFQILHLRWNDTGRSPYGRSLLYTARTAWRKLQVMEEALVVNWITRAFARLLFILDVSNKAPREAQKAIEEFKTSLQVRRLAKNVEGVDHLSVVKDIYLGRSYHEIAGRAQKSLTDVKVLDTSSSAYTNITPIDYYRSKVLMALRTPRAYLGLEEDINAKATLTQEDRRYSRFLVRIQSVLTEAISRTIDLQLAVLGIDPKTIPYVIQWPVPAWTDIVDDAEALRNYAEADKAYGELGVIDRQFIATKHLRMTETEWENVRTRIEAEGPLSTGETGDDDESDRNRNPSSSLRPRAGGVSKH